jgi:hypothetical protein
MILYRGLVLLAALDSTLLGLWALTRPGGLFSLLQLSWPQDGIVWPLVGGLSLAHAVCLLLIVYRPRHYAGLAVVPLIGRSLLAGVWLWLLAARRAPGAQTVLIGLAAHDFVMAVLCGGFLAPGWQRSRLRPVPSELLPDEMDRSGSQEEE